MLFYKVLQCTAAVCLGDESDLVLAFPPGTEAVGIHGGGVSATTVLTRHTQRWSPCGNKGLHF